MTRRSRGLAAGPVSRALIAITVLGLFVTACSSADGERGGPCPAPKTPKTDATTGHYAATYLALSAPLGAAIQNVERGYVYSNPSKVVRARALAAIASFAAAAPRVSWPQPAVRTHIVEMVRDLTVLTAYIKLKNPRDPKSVSIYRDGLGHAASPAFEAGQRIGAELSLPQPVGC